jgi:phasin family protein
MANAARTVRDQNVGYMESARESAKHAADTTRQAAEITQETIRSTMETMSQAFRRSADQFARSFGLSENGQELAREASRNIEAVSECSAILLRGFQEISREWLNLAQHQFQRNLEGVQALASCRGPQEIVAAQTDLVRNNIEEVVQNTRRISETSARVANEAAETFTRSRRASQR